MSDNQQTKQSFMSRELSVRGMGILLFICGSAISYFCVVSPLLAASHHEENLTISIKGIGITPLILALGIAYTFFPAGATELLGHPQKPTRLGWVFAVIAGLLGIPLFLWVKSRLQVYGYRV